MRKFECFAWPQASLAQFDEASGTVVEPYPVICNADQFMIGRDGRNMAPDCNAVAGHNELSSLVARARVFPVGRWGGPDRMRTWSSLDISSYRSAWAAQSRQPLACQRAGVISGRHRHDTEI